MAPEFTDRDREPDEIEWPIKVFSAFQEAPAEPRRGAPDVVDRSIGVSFLRRADTARSTEQAVAPMSPAALTADEIAYRIGAADATAACPAAGGLRGLPPRSQGSAAKVGPELDRLTRGRDRRGGLAHGSGAARATRP